MRSLGKEKGFISAVKVGMSRFVDSGKSVPVTCLLLDEFDSDKCDIGKNVNVAGITKGKGFCGGIKRHGFHGLRATHGVSVSHRSCGSTGGRTEPGKVFKGKKMPGRYGGTRATVKNLRIVHVVDSDKLVFVKGAVPGFNGSKVLIRSSDSGGICESK